jgi:hypothetical protein
MRVTRAVFTLSVAMTLAVGGSAVARAQSHAPAAPVPAQFTATLGAGMFNDQTATTVAAFDATDPRISGTWNETKGITVSQLVDGADGVVSAWWHDITIVNAAGSWTGHSEGFGNAPDFDSDIVADGETIFLVGAGGYEGWTATLFATDGQARAPGNLDGGDFKGVIFPTGWNPVAQS